MGKKIKMYKVIVNDADGFRKIMGVTPSLEHAGEIAETLIKQGYTHIDIIQYQ